jgi:hypothetical protein
VDLIQATQNWDQRLTFLNTMGNFPSPSRPDIPWGPLLPFQQVLGYEVVLFIHVSRPIYFMHLPFYPCVLYITSISSFIL